LTSSHLPQPLDSITPLFGKGAGIAGSEDYLNFYELNNVPADLGRLDLTLTDHLDDLDTHQKAQITFHFSLPLHASQNLPLNQAVTANGITIVLRELHISPVLTTVDLLNPLLNDALKTEQNFYILVINNQPHVGHDVLPDLLNRNGKHGPILGIKLRVIVDITGQPSQWTLTILPQSISGATAPWIFHFTVPALQV
jgi:hypothetical protein